MNPIVCCARLFFACVVYLVASLAHSQTFPDKPIRIISPFAAGSSTDVIARIIGQRISENTGVQVVVDVRPGANGVIGTDAAAKSAPDGYTVVLASNGTHGIAVSMFTKLPYDPVKDFEPIMHVGRVAYVMLVGANAPHNSLQDLVAASKANPGKFSIGYAASVAQLTGELLKSTAGIQMTSVPYKSPVNAFTDLAGGQLDVHFEPLPSGLPMIKGGRLKGLAVTSAKRSALAPDIPTIAEAGLPRLRVWRLDRLFRAGGYAEGQSRQAPRRDRPGHAKHRGEGPPGADRHGTGREHAGAVGRHGHPRNRQMGKALQRGEPTAPKLTGAATGAEAHAAVNADAARHAGRRTGLNRS